MAQGLIPDINDKCLCTRCKKKLKSISFFTYKDGSKCEMCKPCITAHIDNFDPSSFEWILEKFDVPYIPSEWNNLRDKAFAKDPYKMNGMSVLGKYLAKMKLKQWNWATYADTEKILQEQGIKREKQQRQEASEREKYENELKQKLEKGEISRSQYETLVSTQTQNKELYSWGNPITGQHLEKRGLSVYNEYAGNPFQEQNFLPEDEIIDPSKELTKEDKIYLALKWGRLYKPSQWVALQQLYNEFTNSFTIQGAARLDTLKMICKTSLKMNQAIDCGDIDSYQKLSRVYDSMMKSAKFTQAQKKEGGENLDSASAIVDFCQKHGGAIPRYECKQPQDIVDKIIFDLKEYTRNLIYDDKSLAQEIEKYLQDKRISEQMKKDKKQARQKGLDAVELTDQDYIDYEEQMEYMKQEDRLQYLQNEEGE